MRHFSKLWGAKKPTCQSRRIAFRVLSGAFASVPPRRVSIDEPIFSSFAPRGRLFIIVQPDYLESRSGGLYSTSYFVLRYGTGVGIAIAGSTTLQGETTDRHRRIYYFTSKDHNRHIVPHSSPHPLKYPNPPPIHIIPYMHICT